MPRTVSGLGAGSKIPLRGFTQLLKNLSPGTRAQLEEAFGRAEDLIDFHSRTVPERQTRRRLTGLVQAPVLTVEATIIGAFVTWDRVADPRIAFYEVQLSDESTFAAPETFQTLEGFFAVENVVTTKFVRVRGVRADGDAGLFSSTSRIRPTITAPEARAFEFYPGYLEDSLPELGTSLTFGKDLTRELPVFYTIIEETFYADRLTGGFSVWGYASNRLRRMTDGGVTPWDRIRFKLNGVAVLDSYFPHWTNVMDEDAQDLANKFDRDDNDDLMTFYARGGYTASFGPYNVTIPTSFAGDGPNDPHRVIALPADDGIFYWTDFNNSRLPSRFDQAQFTVPSREGKTPGTTDKPSHEAAVFNITDGDKSDFLYFHDFRLKLPEDRVVTGIKAEVKRRQPNIKSSIISPNFGNTRPDKTAPTGGRNCNTPSTEITSVCDDVIMNWDSTDSIQVSEGQDILEDVNFGRFLDISRGEGFAERGDRGPLHTDARGVDDTGFPNFPLASSVAVRTAAASRMIGDNYTGSSGTGFSISLFFNINSLAFTGGGASPRNLPLWVLAPGGGNVDKARVTITANEIEGITAFNANLEGQVTVRGIGLEFGTDAAFDKFHHILVRWSPTAGAIGDADDLEIFLNGRFMDTWATTVIRSTSGLFDGFVGDQTGPIGSEGGGSGGPDGKLRGIGIGEGDWMVNDSDFPGKVAQLAIWDKTFALPEILELKNGVGRLDYRFDAGEYVSSDRLTHYFLFFPDQSDIRDHEVFVVDQGPLGGARIRDDLDNKAKTTEGWPQLGDFFYTDVRQFGILPLPASDGIPHDNHIAIGYENYGGEGDLWGKSSWSAAEVNNFYFGFVTRVTNFPAATANRSHGFVDHGRLTLFFEPEEDRSVRATVEVSVANQFYIEREVFGALFNVIEIGERLASLPDC